MGGRLAGISLPNDVFTAKLSNKALSAEPRSICLMFDCLAHRVLLYSCRLAGVGPKFDFGGWGGEAAEIICENFDFWPSQIL
jgi:hypothetical protein